MAGNGQRFADAGYKKPKPFIDVKGKPMIVHVLDNLKLKNAKFFLIARQEHLDAEKDTAKLICDNYPVTFIPINSLTEGAACSVLYANKYINNESPFMIANSDQIVDFDVNEFYNDSFNRKLDGSILVFENNHPKWSYAKLGTNNLVSEVKEKVCISNLATVGIYLFSQGKTFVEAALDMIVRNERVNNEFYVCPVYNFAIKNNKQIGVFKISQSQMHGIGTPEDLNAYLNLKK